MMRPPRKRAIVAIAFLGCLLVFPSFAAVKSAPTRDQKDYRFVEFFKSPSPIKHGPYTFPFQSPSDIYGSWQRYHHKKLKREVVLLGGLSGLDSYAFSVLQHNALTTTDASPMDVSTLTAAARSIRPSLEFLPVEGNAECVSTDTARPVELDRMMQAFVAICRNPKDGALYEVGLSWRSMILFGGIEGELKKCKTPETTPKPLQVAGAEPSKCFNRIDGMRDSFRAAVLGFRFE